MRKTTRWSPMAAATAAALAGAATDAPAVSLGDEGLGQALVYPYYTVRSSEGGNAFNTYLSVGNSTPDAKAVRVRFREGRAGREVLGFNLYLSPNDLWTAAVVPTAEGARLVTADNSCTDPAFTANALDFRSDRYTGALADGFGDTLDRTREGYVEMIEMSTLTDASRTFVTHNAAGLPMNCPAMRASTSPAVAPPTGGLWGTLTLINVNNGQDFTLNAEALADLATRPYFRPPGDPYPDFAAAEIDPVSVVRANGQLYRSVWSRPVDAVSAVLMRRHWVAEYILDSETASLTDFVVAMPTRRYYVDRTAFAPPFSASGMWNPDCHLPGRQNFGEIFSASYFNREERGATAAGGDPSPPAPDVPQSRLCAAVAVASIHNDAPHMPADTARTAVLGSTTRALVSGSIPVTPGFQAGWMDMAAFGPAGPGSLTSLPQSTRLDLASGLLTAGSHSFAGLPVTGFLVRTFRNGTLACTAGACQGNYGGAFAFKYRRAIAPP